MSEAMSNHEIEDVLSSIRRLVSEDLRPVARPAVKAAETGKLLLTPALRVVDAAPAVAGPDPSEVEGAAAPATEVASGAVQDVVARLGAAVGEGDAEWESPVGDPPAFDGEALAKDARNGPVFAHRAVETPDAAEEGYFLADEPLSFVTAPSIPDVEEPEAVARPPVEPEATVGLRQVAPPSVGDEDWTDAAEAEVRAELESDVAAQASGILTGGEAVYDEEMLRDLVRDIIREELAGTLGERITRNVRKLVRAEIARALAVRDFE